MLVYYSIYICNIYIYICIYIYDYSIGPDDVRICLLYA